MKAKRKQVKALGEKQITQKSENIDKNFIIMILLFPWKISTMNMKKYEIKMVLFVNWIVEFEINFQYKIKRLQ